MYYLPLQRNKLVQSPTLLLELQPHKSSGLRRISHPRQPSPSNCTYPQGCLRAAECDTGVCPCLGSRPTQKSRTPSLYTCTHLVLPIELCRHPTGPQMSPLDSSHSPPVLVFVYSGTVPRSGHSPAHPSRSDRDPDPTGSPCLGGCIDGRRPN